MLPVLGPHFKNHCFRVMANPQCPHRGSEPPGTHLPYLDRRPPSARWGWAWHSGTAAPTPSNLSHLPQGVGCNTPLWAQGPDRGFVALPARALWRGGCPASCHPLAVHLLCICRSSSDALSHSLGSRKIRTDTQCGSGLAGYRSQWNKVAGGSDADGSPSAG